MKPRIEQSRKILAATSEIPTPFLLVQKTVLRKNSALIHSYAKQHGLMVRPHVKTHKSLVIADMQMEAGAVGIAVAKASEAETMAPASQNDITVAYPVLGPEPTHRLAKLAQKRDIRIAVDSFQAIDHLSAAASRFDTILGIMVCFDARPAPVRRSAAKRGGGSCSLCRQITRSTL